MIAALSAARESGLPYTASQASAASMAPVAAACARPVSFNGMSVVPWMRRARFQSVSPWRTMAKSTGPGGGAVEVSVSVTLAERDPRSGTQRLGQGDERLARTGVDLYRRTAVAFGDASVHDDDGESAAPGELDEAH